MAPVGCVGDNLLGWNSVSTNLRALVDELKNDRVLKVNHHNASVSQGRRQSTYQSLFQRHQQPIVALQLKDARLVHRFTLGRQNEFVCLARCDKLSAL